MVGLSIMIFLNPAVWIEWSTASEMETVGFNLYRSEQDDKEFILVNQKLIPGSSDPLRGGNYRFKDQGIKSGKHYLYRLEEIEKNGTSRELASLEVGIQRQGLPELTIGIILILISVILMVRAKRINEK